MILELVYRARESDPDCSILWLPAINAESLQQAYLEAGQQLGISGIKEGRANVMKLVQDHLSQESAGRWLLIFDSADNIDMWIHENGHGQRSPSLKEYLPMSSQGRIVFTTRSRKVAVKLAQQTVIEVSEMDEKIARLLLRKSLINQDLLTSHQDTLELLQKLTFLPLAIVQAAAYINENGVTFLDYLFLLKDQEQNVIDLLSEEFDDEGQYRGKKNPIANTWLISFDQIRRLDPLAAEYLSFMCCINPRDIPQSLLLPAQSLKKEMDAIGTLSAYSFVSRRSADNSLDLHRLVHLATRNWLRREKSLAQWTMRAVARLGEVIPANEHKNRSVWRAYLPHACYVLDFNFIADGVKEKVRLLAKLSNCLFSDGKYNEAERYVNKLLETHTRILGEEHPITLTTMNNMAIMYWGQGLWKEAEKLQVQVIETSKRMLGEEHPDTLTSIANLALTYTEQGRWKDAEKLQVQVIETMKRMLGEEHPNTLTSIANLASTYKGQGQWKEAEELEVQVLETKKRVLGEEHPNTLNGIHNLASTYGKQGRLEEAEELEVQVLEIKRRVLGKEHPDTLISMNNLAITWKSLERDIEASQLMEQCLELRNQKLGADHPYTIGSRETLLEWKAVNPVVKSSISSFVQ